MLFLYIKSRKENFLRIFVFKVVLAIFFNPINKLFFNKKKKQICQVFLWKPYLIHFLYEYRLKFEPSTILNLAILLYVIQFCHTIQYIISIERNETIYAWATLGCIGILFPKQRQLIGIYTNKPYEIWLQRLTNSALHTQVSCSSSFNCFHCWCSKTWACLYSEHTLKHRSCD